MSDFDVALQLFDEPLRSRTLVGEHRASGRSRASDPETSKQAAESISDKSERLVLQTLKHRGPSTADEIVAWLRYIWPDIHPPTIKSAISRCKKRGDVHVATVDGEPITRPSERGRAQTVWLLDRKLNWFSGLYA